MSFNTESIKIYKHLSFTTSELKEDLHTYKYWYFKSKNAKLINALTNSHDIFSIITCYHYYHFRY